jgi:Ran GTPase-activating protein (RanGAP) involved in mRNA processing and transport
VVVWHSEVEQLTGSSEGADLPPISLDLRGNCLPERFNARLASADVFPVTEALRNDVRITSVDLGYNKIDASGAAAVARVLGQNGTLLNINLEFNDIGADGGKSIAEALPSCTSLRQLVLRGNNMGDEAGVAVASGLNASPLELLDISSCDLGLKSIIKVAEAAESADCKLSHLYLSNARTRVNEDQKGIVLGRMIKLNTSLVCLDVSRMKLSDDDAEHIVRSLKVNTTLKSISLAANKFSWVAGGHFGKYLTENTVLEELDLSGNELHDNGVYAMREALIENRRYAPLRSLASHEPQVLTTNVAPCRCVLAACCTSTSLRVVSPTMVYSLLLKAYLQTNRCRRCTSGCVPWYLVLTRANHGAIDL